MYALAIGMPRSGKPWLDQLRLIADEPLTLPVIDVIVVTLCAAVTCSTRSVASRALIESHGCKLTAGALTTGHRGWQLSRYENRVGCRLCLVLMAVATVIHGRQC